MRYDGASVQYIAEQDGETEKEFKILVTGFLSQFEEPIRAYLCRVTYLEEVNPDGFNVAMCLASDTEAMDEMRDGIASIFIQMFGKHEHLDIMFVNKDQEIKIRKVCQPFFS